LHKPTKIVLVGLNYKDHAKELGMPLPPEPILFMKPVTALIGSEERIMYPAQATRVDYEAELAIIVKDVCKDIEPERILIYFYLCPSSNLQPIFSVLARIFRLFHRLTG